MSYKRISKFAISMATVLFVLIVCFSTTGFTDERKISFTLDANEAVSLPKQLDTGENNEYLEDQFNYESHKNIDAKLGLSLEVADPKSNSTTATGNGYIEIKGKKYKFVVTSSKITKFHLPDGNTFWFGNLEIVGNNKRTENIEMSLTVNYYPEFKSKVITLTAGTIDNPRTLIFGSLSNVPLDVQNETRAIFEERVGENN